MVISQRYACWTPSLASPTTTPLVSGQRIGNQQGIPTGWREIQGERLLISRCPTKVETKYGGKRGTETPDPKGQQAAQEV